MNFTKYSKYFVLSLITILVSVVFWYVFYFNVPGKIGFPSTQLETVFANYDGPEYMVIAKCGYTRNCIATKFSLPQPLEYYPAHFPGFPMLIKYLSFYTSTPKAMLIATLLGSILFTLVSFYFFKMYLSEKLAYYLAILSIFFPGRMLVLRIVGAPETWFMGLTLLSIIFFQRRRYILSAVAAALSLLLKSPGVLLFAAYLCMAIFDWVKYKNFKSLFNKYFIYLIGPITALIIFYFYYLQTGDFFAYFHSGDNIHLNFLPYSIFISNHTWINTVWLEDVLYIFFYCLFGPYSPSQKIQIQFDFCLSLYLYPGHSFCRPPRYQSLPCSSLSFYLLGF
jgi:hypothetical protein